jgi:hypothetical protein
MSDTAPLHCTAALAIECELAGAPPQATLDRARAERYGDALAADLLRLFPEIAELDLVCAGALYDQAQLLRPGWPLHAALAGLDARFGSRERSARVLAIGAHEGHFPDAALDPDPRLYGSAMLVMPWLLRGDAGRIAATGSLLERELLDRGMAGADFALTLRELLGVPIRHVRHLTAFDLCALACAQYEHAGLGPLWQIVETALLAPGREQTVELADGGRLHWRGDHVEAGDLHDPRRLAQCAAILGAHGLEVRAA